MVGAFFVPALHGHSRHKFIAVRDLAVYLIETVPLDKADTEQQADTMAMGFHGIWDIASHKRAILRWARAARDADTAALSVVRKQSLQARLLKAHLDRLISVADERLALPVPANNSVIKPNNADWVWRPELWRRRLATPGLCAVEAKSSLGSEITLFHDCTDSELSMRQVRNQRPNDLAPYCLRLDVFRFDGSFLSLLLDLPAAASQGLLRSHIIRLEASVEAEHPIEIFVRLNIVNGPNTEQIVRELIVTETSGVVEFDLAYSTINERRVEKASIDLILEGPEMNQVTLRDLTLSRRPRAQL